MLHYLLQKHGIMPDEVYAKPRGVKNFIYASNLIQIDADNQ